MAILTENSELMDKLLELCNTLAADENFQGLQRDLGVFFQDEEAKLLYRNAQEQGNLLHQKQHAGVELGDAEIREFEAAREALHENEVANAFLSAQTELESVHRAVTQYVGLTLELGRVPNDEDIDQLQNGGCCGGGCGCGDGDGGGCGCSH